jgi:hypothetical protein
VDPIGESDVSNRYSFSVDFLPSIAVYSIPDFNVPTLKSLAFFQKKKLHFYSTILSSCLLLSHLNREGPRSKRNSLPPPNLALIFHASI